MVIDAQGAGESTDKPHGHRLRPGALGLGGVMLMSLASAAPMVGTVGTVPLGIGLGNGIGFPAAYLVVTAVLLLFSVGYAAMARNLPSTGGFYSFISYGLGRPMGLAAGWSALVGYILVEVALIGAFGYFAANTFASLFHVELSWVIYSFVGIAIVGALTYRDVALSAKVLGVALMIEMLSLVLLAAMILIKGGPEGITFAPLSPDLAFKGPAAGIGIFFAFWCFLGFEVVPNYAEESKNPKRHTSIALYACVLIIGLVFGGVAWTAIIGHGMQSVTDAATTNPVDFIYSLSTQYVGVWLTDIMQFFVVLSALACALAFHQTACRYFFALGREGVLPKALGMTHNRFGSPHIAALAQTVIVAVAVGAFIAFWHVSSAAQEFSGDFKSAPYFELYGWLAIATTFWVTLNQILSSIATIVYFRVPERRERMYWWRNLLAPALGGLGMVVALYLLMSNLTTFGGDVIFVKLIPWVCIGWFLVGLGLALRLRAKKPALYAELGRLIVTNVEVGDTGEPSIVVAAVEQGTTQEDEVDPPGSRRNSIRS